MKLLKVATAGSFLTQPAKKTKRKSMIHKINNRSSVNETCLQSFVPDYPITVNDNDRNSVNCNDNQHTSAGNEIFSIARGEGKHPIHFMQDKNCEELAFPVLFPRGCFGYQVERDVKLSH